MSNAERWTRTIVVAGVLAVGIASSGAAASRVVGPLTATSNAPHAHGRAKLTLKTASKGRFQVGARRLGPHASFDVVIGGIKVGTLTTNVAGAGKLKLSTNPRPGEHLLGVDPRGKTVEVRDQNGDDDLEGDMPDGDDNGGSAGGAFACCTSNDGEQECEVETPAECSSKGGQTVDGVQSCIPNPCGTSGGGEVVCCFNSSAAGAFVDEEAENECDETSSQECAMGGGTVVGATSCEPNPCSPVPPPTVTVCCVPQDSEAECEILTPEHCAAQNGKPSDATSCESDPCSADSGGGDSGGGDSQGGDDGGGSSGGSGDGGGQGD